MSRKRKLYVSELLTRCKKKSYHVYIEDMTFTIYFTNVEESIHELSSTTYWDIQVKYWEVNGNELLINI